MEDKKKKKYFTDEFSNEEAQIIRQSDIPRRNLRKDITNEIEERKKREEKEDTERYLQRLRFKKDRRTFNRLMDQDEDYVPEDMKAYRKEALKKLARK